MHLPILSSVGSIFKELGGDLAWGLWFWIFLGAAIRLTMDGKTRDQLFDRTGLEWRTRKSVKLGLIVVHLATAILLGVLICHPCNPQTALFSGVSLGFALEILVRKIAPA